MSNITILGAGLAGFGAAHRLHCEGQRAVLYDKHSYHGGHAASFPTSSGFIFDDGPHISFTKNQRIQKLFAESVRGDFQVIQARVNNYWRGHWIKHPAQSNLRGLPTDLVVRIIDDFVRSAATSTRAGPRGQANGQRATKNANCRPSAANGKPRNYAQWLVASYGRTFAECFPMQYGRKYHTTTAENMTTDWLGPRMHRPDLAELLRGALTDRTPDVHYVTHFRYPTHRGFVSFLNQFVDQADLRLGWEVTRIVPDRNELHFRSGAIESYQQLISSIPLPALIPLIEKVPEAVRSATQRLACTSCVVVNLGIDRADISPAHWTYFYDDDYVFSRLSFPHMLSPGTVPPGAGSIQAEVYFSQKYRPLTQRPQEFIRPVLRDLRRCGLLREDDRLIHREARLIPYANVIFDHDRHAALQIVHGFLEELGITWCGRYGEWGYHWTDESFLSGERAAQHVLDAQLRGHRLRSPSAIES